MIDSHWHTGRSDQVGGEHANVCRIRLVDLSTHFVPLRWCNVNPFPAGLSLGAIAPRFVVRTCKGVSGLPVAHPAKLQPFQLAYQRGQLRGTGARGPSPQHYGATGAMSGFAIEGSKPCQRRCIGAVRWLGPHQ